jgi:hypothetical protein
MVKACSPEAQRIHYRYAYLITVMYTICLNMSAYTIYLQIWIFQRSQDAASSRIIRINSLDIDRKYPVLAEHVVTKCSPTVLLSNKDSPYNIVTCFVPRRYGSDITDQDIASINTRRVKLNLISKGLCEKSKS